MTKNKKTKDFLGFTISEPIDYFFIWFLVVALFVTANLMAHRISDRQKQMALKYGNLIKTSQLILTSPDKRASNAHGNWLNDAYKRRIVPLWCPYLFSGMPCFGSLMAATDSTMAIIVWLGLYRRVDQRFFNIVTWATVLLSIIVFSDVNREIKKTRITIYTGKGLKDVILCSGTAFFCWIIILTIHGGTYTTGGFMRCYALFFLVFVQKDMVDTKKETIKKEELIDLEKKSPIGKRVLSWVVFLIIFRIVVFTY